MYPGERKPPFYLLTGLIIGVVFGVIFAWVFIPVEPIDLAPGTLRDDFKDEYRELIAFAFLSNGDIGRANSRLELLGDDNHSRTLEIQAQEAMGQFAKEHIARALGLLAEELSDDPESTPQFHLTEQVQGEVSSSPDSTESSNGESIAPIETQETPPPTATGIFLPTATSNASSTPTISQEETVQVEKIFLVTKQEMICEVQKDTPKLIIYVYSDSTQVSWVGVKVDWGSGVDIIFTGMKPDLGDGYADFEMKQQVLYSVSLRENSETLDGISWAECENADGDTWWGSWEIHFSTDY